MRGGAIVAGLSLLILGVIRKNKRFLKFLAVGVIICFWLLNCVQLPYYSNVIACGSDIEDDAVKIAEYLNTSDVSDIYYIRANTANPYLQNCYGYFKQSFAEIELDQVEDYSGLQDNVFIVIKDPDVEKEFEKFDLKRLELKTDILDIYVAEDYE